MEVEKRRGAGAREDEGKREKLGKRQEGEQAGTRGDADT